MLFEFVSEAIPKFDEDPEVYPVAFVDAMIHISRKLASLTMMDDYKPYMNALHLYTRFGPLVAEIARHSRFISKVEPQDIERKTIFGPFFQLSPLQPAAILRDFANPRDMDASAIRIAQDSVRVQCSTHQKELLTIISTFVRHSAEARNRVLDWFAYILNTNQKRRAMRVDPREVASDGFMMNVTAVLDLLSEPFLDNTFAKVDRIDVNYFRRKPRIDIDEETKLHADLAESKAFWGTPAPGENNFITEVFVLTLAAHHYGTEAINSQYKNMDRDIKWMEKQIRILEGERAKITAPLQMHQLENAIRLHTSALNKAVSTKHAVEGVLLDPGMQGLSLRFMRYVAVWLLRVASGTDYKPSPDKTIVLPLSEPAPKEFACLPEYAIMSLVDNFKFISRFMPQILIQAVGDELVMLCITFLHTSNYIKNPYLKSSLVTILYWGTLDFTNRKGVLVPQLTDMKFANDYLLHALMKFYIECESTGAHTQFYDKFNIRFEIFQVIKVVWVNNVYKRQLTRESEHNTEFFVRFVNMLLNDATYVLDEALTKFPKINDLERQVQDFDQEQGSQEDKAKLEEELQTAQHQATSYMQLANESLEMMKLFTKALVSAFTMPEIVNRLASMMNYNLETLVGPKAGQLRVTKPDQYKFRPVILVLDFIIIYLNLGASAPGPSQLFINAVAADGRCYKPENFAKAGSIVGSRNMADPKDLENWRLLQARLKEAKDTLDQAELDLGDIPSEFEDPIMGDLMTDPVRLPSKHIVDRQTIVQHLLSDPKDPFTRQPMTIDDVVPATELKERIEAWRLERMAAAKASAMDTTE
jgi:ubiquitin conjugation factor E4 B